MKQYTILAGIFLALVVGVGANITLSLTVGKAARQEAERTEAAFDKFERSLRAAGAVDEEIGETELTRDAVAAVLRYSKIYYGKVVRHGKDPLYIYVAYWAPGRASPREVAFHTPDHCWVHAGWRRVASQIPLPASLMSDLDCKARSYEHASGAANVAFWHLLGDTVVSYGDSGIPSDFSWVEDLMRFGLNQKRAQIFLRLHSTSPLSSFDGEEAIALAHQFLATLRQDR